MMKERIIISIRNGLFLFCIVWLPIIIGTISLYALAGAENPRQWDIVFEVVLITSSFVLIPFIIGGSIIECDMINRFKDEIKDSKKERKKVTLR